MTQFLRFALLGVGAGGLYALIGQGLVLIYRGSGVLNFAQGTFAAAGAYLFYALSQQAGWPTIPSIALVVVGLTLFGALVHLVVMRKLARATPFVRLIATLGMFIAVEQGIVLKWGSDPLVLPSFLPSNPVSLGSGIAIGEDRLIVLGLVLAISLALSAWLRFARTGLAISATADDPTAAAALGWSPIRLGALTWGLGTGLAAIGGILLAPISGLDPRTLALVVVPALAGALVGGFRSFSLTLLGGLLVGIAESLTSFYVTAPGWSSSVPFIVIIAALLVRGRALPQRGQLIERLPRVGSGRVNLRWAAGVLVVSLALVLFVLPPIWTDGVSTSLQVALVCASLVVVTGFAGQLSLAQFALAGVGALIAGRLAVAGVPYLIALPLAALSTIPIGVLVGVVALRARGAALAIATLGLGLIIQDLVLQDVTWTGGQNGLAVGTFRLLGLNVSPVQYSGRYAAVLILVVAAVLWSIASLRRSPVGKRLIAVRGNERAAAALGINVTVSKLYAFAIAAAIAGLAGALIAFQTDLLTFDNFDVQQSINVIALAVIGGIALLAGPVIGSLYAAGGFFAVAISEVFGASVSKVLVLASGLTTILLVVQAPDGLAGTPLPEFLRRRKRTNPPPRPSATPVTTAAVVARPLLVEGLDVRFGGVHAVRDLSLRVDPGTIVGLIGPNGAGKTTFIDAVSGLVSCRATQITLGEHSLIGLPAHRRAQLGLGRTFQAVELFEDLTIRDNLLAAEVRPRVGHWLRALLYPGQQGLSSDAAAIVELLGLRDLLDALPSELSQAQRRVAAIARSLAARPSVLLLDEPASGLTPVEGRELGQTLRRLVAESDVGILLVEHDVDLVMSASDRVVAIDFGAKLADGPPSEVRRDRQVVAAYLGIDEADEPVTTSTAGERA